MIDDDDDLTQTFRDLKENRNPSTKIEYRGENNYSIILFERQQKRFDMSVRMQKFIAFVSKVRSKIL